MPRKYHLLFSKKILNFFSRLSVCSLRNSEADPTNLQFLDNSNHQINVITYNNNVTV